MSPTSVPMRMLSEWSRVPALLSVATLFVGLGLTTGRAEAAEYYVAPTPIGSDTAAGSMTAPFATLQKGADVAVAGDTVWLRAGKYLLTRQVRISKSGQSDTNRIKFFAYPGELPVLDFSGYVSTNTGADVPQILITGSWLHLKGLEIANGKVQPSGSHSNSALRSNGGSNNIYELLNIHHHFGPGLFIDKGTGGNLILNCDSHDNYDKDGSQGDGENGDGFGVHYQTTGTSTIIRGCRAWMNSDDGYDLISQEFPVRIENSWAFSSGVPVGNGNGFKVGSSLTGVRHIVTHNVAWKNKASGFYANHSSGGNDWLNNTSYMNGTQYNMLASPPGDSAATIILSGALAHKMRNNIGFPNRNSNMGGVDTMFNTWDLGIAESAAVFVSTADTDATGPRQADGSMPAMDFLRLRAGSPVIDKGTNVMLPFVGAAPDLGAYEYGAATNPGSGGSTVPTGSGGAPGSGGISGSGGRGGANGSTGGSTGSGTGGIGTGGRGVIASGGVVGTGGHSPGSGGDSPAGTGGSGAGGTGGASGAGNGGQLVNAPDVVGGCACAVDSSATGGGTASLVMLAAVSLLLSRRRRKTR